MYNSDITVQRGSVTPKPIVSIYGFVDTNQ